MEACFTGTNGRQQRVYIYALLGLALKILALGDSVVLLVGPAMLLMGFGPKIKSSAR